jgi:hypothetical protein
MEPPASASYVRVAGIDAMGPPSARQRPLSKCNRGLTPKMRFEAE